MYMRSSGGICSELGSLPFSSYSLAPSLSLYLASPRYLEFSYKKKKRDIHFSFVFRGSQYTRTTGAIAPGCVRV